MAGFLLPNHALEPFGDLIIRRARAQVRAQVVLGHTEQTGADLAVRSQPDAIAVAAKGLADRRDDSDLAPPIREGPAPGSRGGIVGGNRPQVEPGLQAGQNLAARHDHFLEPGARGIERHEFDKAQTQVALVSEARQRFDFVVVKAADDDGVDLYRVEAEFLREADALQDLVQGRHGP